MTQQPCGRAEAKTQESVQPTQPSPTDARVPHRCASPPVLALPVPRSLGPEPTSWTVLLPPIPPG